MQSVPAVWPKLLQSFETSLMLALNTLKG